MSNDRVLSVYDCGIVTAFIEHTHVYAKDIGEVNGSGHCSFVRADDHQVIIVNAEIRNPFDQRFQELISREKVVKSV